MASCTTNAGPVIVDVAPDRMAAWIRREASGADTPPSREEIVAALEAAKVITDDAVRARITELVEHAGEDVDWSANVLIAQGRPPVEGEDGNFVWGEDFQSRVNDWREDGPADYYHFNSIVTVDSDHVIGTLIPARPAQEGVDVLGDAVKPRRRPRDVELGRGVARSGKDPGVVVSSLPGRVIYEDLCLRIIESVEIKGDVNFETGCVNASVDVTIGGTVLDGFEVQSQKSVTVGGAIERAVVEARGDVVVRGGIVGRSQGHVRAGAAIVARFCDEAELRAGGDVKIAKEVINSSIEAGGKLLASHSALIGGILYARHGIEAHSLGSPGGIPTLAAVGIHPRDLLKASQCHAEARRLGEKAARIRQTLQPLMTDMKRLTASQRERATELLYEADIMDEEVVRLHQERDRLVQHADGDPPPYVLVNGAIHEHVTVRIDRRETTFQTAEKGPVRIEDRKVDGAPELVAVNTVSGSVRVLASSAASDQTLAGELGSFGPSVEEGDGSRG